MTDGHGMDIPLLSARLKGDLAIMDFLDESRPRDPGPNRIVMMSTAPAVDVMFEMYRREIEWGRMALRQSHRFMRSLVPGQA